MNSATPQLERCPHCGSDARLDPHDAYRFKCRACGRPRIPMDASVMRTEPSTLALLKQAHGRRLAKIGWGIASFGLGVSAAVMAVMTLTANYFFQLGAFGNIAFAFAALVPAILSVLTYLSSKRASQASSESVQAAWQDAANQLYSARGGQVSAEQFALLTGTSQEEATTMLAEAEVQDLLNPGGSSVKLRVDPSAAQPGTDARSQSIEEEAMAELEQALGNASTQAFDPTKR